MVGVVPIEGFRIFRMRIGLSHANLQYLRREHYIMKVMDPYFAKAGKSVLRSRVRLLEGLTASVAIWVPLPDNLKITRHSKARRVRVRSNNCIMTNLHIFPFCS